MQGEISKWDVLSHPMITIQCFGWMTFFRAVFSPQDKTFLSLLTEADTFRRPRTFVPEFIEQCMELEQRAMRLYQELSVRFVEDESAREFFKRLAEQERLHADLLELCRVTARRGRWRQHHFDPWREIIPQIDQCLEEAETRLAEQPPLVEILRLVLRVETSQINGLFTRAVESTDPRFLSRFGIFRNAVRDHLKYISGRIPELEPELKSACEELQVA